jgi:hypothetical protein
MISVQKLKMIPTVLINNKNEEITSYILFTLLVSDKETERSIGMKLMQEEIFMCSWTEMTNDNSGKTKTIANTKIAKTIYFKRHYDFYLRGNCAIIGAGKMCSTGVGRKSLVSRPKNKRVIFFEKRSYTAKISGFSVL